MKIQNWEPIEIREKEKYISNNIGNEEFFDEIWKNYYNKNEQLENLIENEINEKDKIINNQFNPYTIKEKLNTVINQFIHLNPITDDYKEMDIYIEKD